MSTQEVIETLHGLYCRQTGQTVRLSMDRIFIWEVWLARGFTKEDLFDLVRHLRSEIQQARRNPGCLKFSNLIGHPDTFEEDLALLRAHQRPKAPPSRTIRSGATERIVSDPNTRDTSVPARVPLERVIAAMREQAGDRSHSSPESHSSLPPKTP